MAMFNWIKRRKTISKFRKTDWQDRPGQSTFRPRLEPLEERMLLYAGALDQGFGLHGLVLDSPFNALEGGTVSLQSDGKILLAGSANSTPYEIFADQFILERYNPDGTPDSSFGTGGKVETHLAPFSVDEADSIAVQADGKILVAGGSFVPGGTTVSFAIVRYNSDGTLDPTFNGGIVLTDFTDTGADGARVSSIAVQSDGKIVAAGTGGTSTGASKFALARYNADGTLDSTFGRGTGKVLTDFNFNFGLTATEFADVNSVTVQSDGRIVLAGSARDSGGHQAFALARYNADGSLDPDFQGGGKIVTTFPLPPSPFPFSEAKSVLIQADGKIVATGWGGDETSPTYFLLARYNPNGVLDGSFGSGGLVMSGVPGEATGAALEPDGKIVVAGTSLDAESRPGIGLARFNPDGSLDKTFNFGGIVTTDPTTSPNLYLPSGFSVGFYTSFATSMAIEPDGKIVAGGMTAVIGATAQFVLARYLGEAGRLSFDLSATSLPESGEVVPIIHDGHIIIPPGSGGNAAVLTVNRTGGATGTVTVDYATSDGTATAGVDYAATAGSLTFLDGETSKTISIPILDDGTLEGGIDTFSVTLSNPTGEATLGAVTKSVVTIKDDDIIGSSVSGTEGLPLTGVVATFAPSNPSVGAGDFVATIDWGDGTADAPDLTPGTITPVGSGRFNVTGTHTYAEEGSYPLAVHITGASTMDTSNLFSATVNDAPLKATAVNFSVTGHKSFSGVVANFTDVDPGGGATDYTATITWDDGTTSPGTIGGSGPFTVSGSNVFGAFTGTHTISVTIADSGAPVSITDIIKDPLAPSVAWGNWSPAVNWTDVKTGDFNGDGKADIAGWDPGTGRWWVGLSTGSAFNTTMWGSWSTAVNWVDVKVGDFNGDGKADIAGRVPGTGQWWVSLSTGSSFTNSLWTTWSPSVHWLDVQVGDFNGDGKADLVGRAEETGQLWVAQSTGSSFTNSLWATWSTAATWVDVNVGDFNGDGKADVTGRYLQGGAWWTAISTGSSFTSSLWATWSTAATWVDVQVGDFNGDSKADLTGRYLQAGSWWTAISTGSSFTSSLWAIWSTGVTWVDVKVGDFTHDGKADIVGRASGTGHWWVAQSAGSSFSSSLWATWSPNVTWADVQIGDFEGDGTAQIIGQALSSGYWWTGL
jgi:uncharacterized delta-60 repeat protein